MAFRSEADSAAYKKRWNAENRERKRQKDREWYLRNRDKVLAKSKRHALKRFYGITQEDFDRLSEQQGGCCAICRKPSKLCVDHCHNTGVIRGLLCNGCNLLLGYAEDQEATLEAAIGYLKEAQRTQGT